MRNRCVFSPMLLSAWIALGALWNARGSPPPPLEWAQQSGYRVARLKVASGGKSGFTRLDARRTGIGFTNRLARSRYTTNQIYLNGSGVAAGDVNGDDRVDVFFAALDGENALYLNLGDWRFKDVAREAGVAAPGLDCTGAALVDFDGDGDLDLIVNSIGQGTHFFTNDGRAHFVWNTRTRAPNAGKGGMSLALADVDGDGDLDLYLANYRTWTYRDRPKPKIRGRHINGRPVVIRFDGRPTTDPDLVGRFTLSPKHKIIENGEIDAFYLNQGQGRFVRERFNQGRFLDERGNRFQTPPFDWGLSAMFRDITGDGAPELYVCNDFGAPDRFWINDGSGRFQAASYLAQRNSSRFSMGLDVADIDRDGHDDVFVADMLSRDHDRRQQQMPDPPLASPPPGGIEFRPQFSRNTLQWNRGDNTFAEIAFHAGVYASEWSWTPAFLDVDLDGFEDLLITTGHQRDALNADVMNRIKRQERGGRLTRSQMLELQNQFPRLATPNVAFRNRGDLTFEDATDQWGFGSEEVSHGMAFADLDQDGDLDVVINNLNGLAGVYRNNGTAPRVAVRLRGDPPNTEGIGGRIKLLGGPVAPQQQEIICGGRYLSSDDAMRVFAAGSIDAKLAIEVTWRSGKKTVLRPVEANHVYQVFESSATKPAAAPKPSRHSPPLFTDTGRVLAHLHHDDPFNDFERQPLLPRRLSRLGPGIAWFDLDGDGWEDLIIGSGRGGRLAVRLNDGKGGFVPLHQPPISALVTRDQTTVLGWADSKNDRVVLAGSANYEDGLPAGGAVRQYSISRGLIDDSIAATRSSTGPLAMADFDGDGDLDLFVGGRVIAGRYPEPASSRLLRREASDWVADPASSRAFHEIGLVSGAVWSDLENDGFPELVLACEWGPIRLFENHQGHLEERTKAWGLDGLKGWWNGVTAGDFDEDGRLDLLATNWGTNHRYQPLGVENLRLYYRSASARAAARFPLVEGYLDAARHAVVPLRRLPALSAVAPVLRKRFPTFEAFGKATVEGLFHVLGVRPEEIRITTLSTVVLLNRGSGFEMKALPVEAQLAPAFGVNVADFDGDGHQDLFLSQNFFGGSAAVDRMDAGRGLCLLGNGRGEFRVLPAARSGIAVYGEQRGSAVADYDRDGRVDLAVTQNRAATRLFRNIKGRPGLRVRLRGPADNPLGIGAVVRLQDSQGLGPAWEVHAGSGYWSQDSAVLVMTCQGVAEAVQVRWPGGIRTRGRVPAGAKQITVNFEGKVVKDF